MCIRDRHQGIRAALCWTAEIAHLARQHNDANVLVMPGPVSYTHLDVYKRQLLYYVYYIYYPLYKHKHSLITNQEHL